MSSPSAQPERHGSFSQENLPQVVVRAEKHYLCSSCGTLVEIPADVVGKLGWAEQQPRQQPPVEEAATSDAAPQAGEPAVPVDAPSVHTKEQRTTTQMRCRQPNPRRCVTTNHPTWAGKAIDGITVPTGQQLDQAFKWVTFHLKILDRQEGEIKRLKKLLKTEQRKTNSTNRVPRPSPLGRAGEATQQASVEPTFHASERHAQADLGVAHGMSSGIASDAHERGPP